MIFCIGLLTVVSWLCSFCSLDFWTLRDHCRATLQIMIHERYFKLSCTLLALRPYQGACTAVLPEMRHSRGRVKCGCACAFTRATSELDIENDIDLSIFSYIQVQKNYLLRYSIYSNPFWDIAIKSVSFFVFNFFCLHHSNRHSVPGL